MQSKPWQQSGNPRERKRREQDKQKEDEMKQEQEKAKRKEAARRRERARAQEEEERARQEAEEAYRREESRAAEDWGRVKACTYETPNLVGVGPRARFLSIYAHHGALPRRPAPSLSPVKDAVLTTATARRLASRRSSSCSTLRVRLLQVPRPFSSSPRPLQR